MQRYPIYELHRGDPDSTVLPIKSSPDLSQLFRAMALQQGLGGAEAQKFVIRVVDEDGTRRPPNVMDYIKLGEVTSFFEEVIQGSGWSPLNSSVTIPEQAEPPAVAV